MKKEFKTNISSSLIIILLSITLMIYFGYNIIKPIMDSINTEIQITDHISIIKKFFE